jgi:hypothetical protein
VMQHAVVVAAPKSRDIFEIQRRRTLLCSRHGRYDGLFLFNERRND